MVKNPDNISAALDLVLEEIKKLEDKREKFDSSIHYLRMKEGGNEYYFRLLAYEVFKNYVNDYIKSLFSLVEEINPEIEDMPESDRKILEEGTNVLTFYKYTLRAVTYIKTMLDYYSTSTNVTIEEVVDSSKVLEVSINEFKEQINLFKEYLKDNSSKE